MWRYISHNILQFSLVKGQLSFLFMLCDSLLYANKTSVCQYAQQAFDNLKLCYLNIFNF